MQTTLVKISMRSDQGYSLSLYIMTSLHNISSIQLYLISVGFIQISDTKTGGDFYRMASV